MKQILPGVWTWEWFSPEKQYMFNGTLIEDHVSKVIVDPAKMTSEDLARLRKMGPFEAIYLSNKDHERAAYELRRELKIPIWIHKKDAAYLREKPDYTFFEGQQLACGIEVLHLPDQKSPGESVFYLRDRKILIFGDALIGFPAGKLNLLPAMKYKDFGRAKAALERLRPLTFEVILVGDGSHILSNAHQVLEDFFFRCAVTEKMM